MIIWLNGAFGAGKTQTAYELKRRIPNSMIYDPEQIGFLINKTFPTELREGDFQDIPIWRELNYINLKYLVHNYDGIIIVPMTIVNPLYYEEIIGKLKTERVRINHFVLWASKETLIKRLRSRGERKNSWGQQQIERCIQGLSNPIFKEHIETDELTIENVSETIAAKLGIQLLDDKRNKLKKKYDRLILKIKRI